MIRRRGHDTGSHRDDGGSIASAQRQFNGKPGPGPRRTVTVAARPGRPQYHPVTVRDGNEVPCHWQPEVTVTGIRGDHVELILVTRISAGAGNGLSDACFLN